MISGKTKKKKHEKISPQCSSLPVTLLNSQFTKENPPKYSRGLF